ncbi:C-type lectin domain family 14 member A [Paramormyrops kingsleyae]|uniref:C-type lectin domain family 14 member A n=1 Tax=Paramormyrops kingsleyae TaxID=1676925 RepID=UPI000CD5F6DA|nr:layilin-like [Paramormyrops kingsleyae]
MEHWIFLMFFIRVHCQHAVKYFVHNEKANFNDAITMCQDSGFLTDMSSMEEVNSGILPAVSHALHSKGNFSFWIGLKKFKEQCFEKGQPLFGFVWTVNNSSLSDVKKWRYHPRETCLNILCGSLSVEYSGSIITDWGFEEKKCNAKQKFICKKVSEEKSTKPDKNGTLNRKGTGLFLSTNHTESSDFILSVQPPVTNNAPSTSTLRMVTAIESSEIQHSKFSVFMPVLIALSVLVLLVIVILVIVKCCLIRRTRRCKGKKSKETVDLKDRDSEEQLNEKDSLRN